MVTQNPRLNVVLEPELYSDITCLARKAGVSLSLMARDLLKKAVEFQEDPYWQTMTQERERNFHSKTALSHKNVWK